MLYQYPLRYKQNLQFQYTTVGNELNNLSVQYLMFEVVNMSHFQIQGLDQDRRQKNILHPVHVTTPNSNKI